MGHIYLHGFEVDNFVLREEGVPEELWEETSKNF